MAEELKNPVGRPRTSSPSPEKCIELGEDLVKWAMEKTDEWRCLFQQWYSLKQGILRKDWKTLIQSPEFLPYYEKAQSALAIKCMLLMKEGFGHRYIRLYDRDLIEEENENKKFEADLRVKEAINIHQNSQYNTNYPELNPNDTSNTVKILPEIISNSDTLGS